MTFLPDIATRKYAAATSPHPEHASACTTSPSGIRSAVRDAARGGRALLSRFIDAIVGFIVGDSGVETGWPCLRCSAVTHATRDFIANQGGVDGWRFRLEHGGGVVGAIAAKFNVDPASIVVHPEGEACIRARIGDCDVCLCAVDLDPISDGCPFNPSHFVSSKRAKPRTTPRREVMTTTTR